MCPKGGLLCGWIVGATVFTRNRRDFERIRALGLHATPPFSLGPVANDF